MTTKQYDTLKLEKRAKRELKAFASMNGITLSDAVYLLLKAGTAIEKGIIKTLQEGPTIPDLGGKTTTFGMAKGIAEALA